MTESSAEALIMPRSKIRSCWSSQGRPRVPRRELPMARLGAYALSTINPSLRSRAQIIPSVTNSRSNIPSMAMPFGRAFISGAGRDFRRWFHSRRQISPSLMFYYPRRGPVIQKLWCSREQREFGGLKLGLNGCKISYQSRELIVQDLRLMSLSPQAK